MRSRKQMSNRRSRNPQRQNRPNPAAAAARAEAVADPTLVKVCSTLAAAYRDGGLSDTVMDVRLAFDFGGKKQIVYLDRVVFIRE